MRTERHLTTPPPLPPDALRSSIEPPPLPPDARTKQTSLESEKSVETESKTTTTSFESTRSQELTEVKSFEKEKEKILVALRTFEIEINGEQDKDKLKQSLLNVMEVLHRTMHEVAFDTEDEERLNNFSFNVVGELIKARDGSDQDVQVIFNDVFRDFSDVIDHGYLSQTTFSGQSVEDMVHHIYGRTPEEVELLKQKNREHVAKKITEFAEAPDFKLDMLLEMFRIYNKDVIPTSMMQFRDTAEANASVFGRAKRIGLLPGEQVRRELGLFEERVNHLIDRRTLGMNEVTYQVRVAKLHDELLDMHPLADRNGSTALLFAELMMAKEGYTPSTERNTNYYEHVADIFKHNYVAVAVVGYQHYLTKFVPGYYKPGIKTEGEAQKMEQVMEHMEAQRPQKKSWKERLSGFRKKKSYQRKQRRVSKKDLE